MVAKLKLVQKATSKVVDRPRPFKTHYYQQANHSGKDWCKISHAGSKLGAIRAAVAKVFSGQYFKAVVHDEYGVTLYTVTRIGSTIKIVGIFMEQIDGSVR